MKFNIQLFADSTLTPKTSMKTKLSYATTLTGQKTDVGYVQSIPALKSPADPITYGALDLEEEQSAKGTRKAETLTIPILFTETQHDAIQALVTAETEVFWFVQYPEATASQSGKPLTFYFTGTCDLSNEAIEIDGMLQENITIYRSSQVMESKGYPVEE